MDTLADINNLIKNNRISHDDLSLDKETQILMDKVQRDQESINGKKTSLLEKFNQFKIAKFCTIGATAILGFTAVYHGAIKPTYQNVSSAIAIPSHYSIGTSPTGNENAAMPAIVQKAWIDANIANLHGVVKKELAPDLDKALKDGNLSVKETTDLSNKISTLNQKFFGTSIPSADAKPRM